MGLISLRDRLVTWSEPELIAHTCATIIITGKKYMGKFFDMDLRQLYLD